MSPIIDTNLNAALFKLERIDKKKDLRGGGDSKSPRPGLDDLEEPGTEEEAIEQAWIQSMDTSGTELYLKSVYSILLT